MAVVERFIDFATHPQSMQQDREFSCRSDCRPQIFLTHGEDRGRQPLAASIEQRFRINPKMPDAREVIEL
jgi:hypothetical protein